MSRAGIVRSLALVVWASAGCGGTNDQSGFVAPEAGVDAAGADAAGGQAGDASAGRPDSGKGPAGSPGSVTDFPTPIIAGSAPGNAATLFGGMGQGAATGGPCLVEPENDVLYPQNWLRPRFTWSSANGETLFELRLHVANQSRDLLVYTTDTTWTMPASMWNALRTDSAGQAMTLTVRGAVYSGGALQGEALGTSTPMGIAPVQATGAIVYWTTNDTTTGNSALKGFSPGDETVEQVLSPMQYAQAQNATSSCIGCHTSSPDGEFVAFTTTTTNQTEWVDALARIDPDGGTVGAAPSYVSSAGAQALARWNAGAVAFSAAHWTTGDRKGIVSYDNGNSASDIVLSWFDVEATSAAAASGTIARNGDTQLAGAPAWSHDGNTIAYVSTNRVCTGRLGNCTPQYDAPSDPGSRADLYTVPYAGGAGGSATPLPGASDPNLQEYYPSFSPDDKWIVMNRIPNDENLYDQPAAEVFVVPAKAGPGATATRLAANDPPACSGRTSPGLTNSWGKWGPAASTSGGSTYYWIVFSSKRGTSGVPQLYITSLVVSGSGTPTTHGAIYLWNQPPTESNHTPAWDTFKVPPIVIQ